MGNNKTDDALESVAGYFSAKLAEHGTHAKGVDWNGESRQFLSFEKLLKILPDKPGHFSINDLGCGYGALYDYLRERYPDFSYIGCDISKEMIAAATERHGEFGNARYVTASAPPDVAQFGVASGTFNMRLGHSDAEWEAIVLDALDILDRTSSVGFAFNCLTSYSDPDRMRDDLYYPDPRMMFDVCKRKYSRNVALLHDYDAYEFTILVRKVL